MMGIYVIKNTKDNKVYVGSAYNLEKRELEDFRLLRNKKHYSSKLQKIYNKYGKSIFLFELIEYIEKKKDLFNILAKNSPTSKWNVGGEMKLA